MKQTILIHPDDNVVVALKPFHRGDSVQENGLTVRDDIPAGHKIALRAIKKGTPVTKYGLPIGEATRDIAQGEHVHTHNLKTMLSGELDYRYAPKRPVIKPIPARTFMGYKRKVGRAGVRNELWIIPTVGCINDVARALRQRAQALVGGAVESVNVFEHPFGCSQMGDDQEDTRTILADLAVHPNAGGVLVVGLGCENSPVNIIRKAMPPYDESRVRFMVLQEVDDELETGMRLLQELADNMQNDRREEVPADQLVVGPQMRRFGRAFGHHVQPVDRALFGQACRHGRLNHPHRGAGDVRRGNPADGTLRNRGGVSGYGRDDQRFQTLLRGTQPADLR